MKATLLFLLVSTHAIFPFTFSLSNTLAIEIYLKSHISENQINHACDIMLGNNSKNYTMRPSAAEICIYNISTNDFVLHGVFDYGFKVIAERYYLVNRSNGIAGGDCFYRININDGHSRRAFLTNFCDVRNLFFVIEEQQARAAIEGPVISKIFRISSNSVKLEFSYISELGLSPYSTSSAFECFNNFAFRRIDRVSSGRIDVSSFIVIQAYQLSDSDLSPIGITSNRMVMTSSFVRNFVTNARTNTWVRLDFPVTNLSSKTEYRLSSNINKSIVSHERYSNTYFNEEKMKTIDNPSNLFFSSNFPE